MALRPTSDLGSLMQKALEEYNEATKGLDKDPYPERMEARSMKDVQDYVANHVDDFKHFRHPGTRLDVIRTSIGNCLNQLQAMSNVLAGPATTAFPAAAPIFTAINFLIFTGNAVRTEFDNMVDFLTEVGDCMNSISIIEGYICTQPIPQLDDAFKNIFAAVLTLCGISTKYIKDGRLEHGFLKGLFNNDRGLKGAHQRLQRAMANLGTSVQNGTFRGVVEINAGMQIIQDQVMELERLANQQLVILKDIRDEQKEQNLQNPGRIRIYFAGFAFWEASFESCRKRFVCGTADWMLQDETYKDWAAIDKMRNWGQVQSSFLWVSGGTSWTGSGKTMLAYKVVDFLKAYAAKYRGMSVAYFFFPREKVLLRDALYSLIVQIADQDELYCREAVSRIKTSNQSKAESNDNVAIWEKWIADYYVSGSSLGKLYVVLDGIEELSDDQKPEKGKALQDLQKIVGQLISDKRNIKLLLFGRDQLKDKFRRIGGTEVPHIDVTAEKIQGAVKLFIDDRLGKCTAPLDEDSINQVKETLSKNITGFAFADSLLNEIEKVDQVEDIPALLEHPPTDLGDILKLAMDRILDKLPKGREDKVTALKIMLYWSAMTFDYLTVKELHCVLAMKTAYSKFNIVVEVTNSCADLLWLDIDPEDAKHDHDDVQISSETSTMRYIRKTQNEIYSRSLIKFRDFRFEEFFKSLGWSTRVGQSNGLIENSHLACFEIAITTMKLITCTSPDPHYDISRALEHYSVKWWDTHLAALDDYFDQHTDEQVSSIIKAMKDIFTLPETMSVGLEKYDVKMYENFISAKVKHDETPIEDRGLMMRWLLKAKSIGAARLGLSLAELNWVEEVISSPPKLLTSLMEEHVNHWFNQTDITTAYQKFEFVLSALMATGTIDQEPDKVVVTEAVIIQVLKTCPGYEMGENAYRAVGATFSHYGFNERAVGYFLRAEERSTTSRGKFDTWIALGRAYLLARKYREAEATLSKALTYEEEMLSGKDDLEYVQVLLRIAYKKLGRTLWASDVDPPGEPDAKRAISAYERAIQLLLKGATISTNVPLVNRIYYVLTGVKDHKTTIEKVCSWDTKLFAAWLMEDLEYEAGKQVALQNAAKEADSVEDLIKFYKAAIDSTEEEGDSILMRTELASFQWKILDNEDLAHEELHNLMDTKGSSRNAKIGRYRASLLLSEMMYGPVKLSKTVWMKRLLCADLATISQKNTDSALNVWNIRPNIPLALAYLACHQKSEAVKLVDSTFSLCMDLLRDNVTWNDAFSLRLLAKLLEMVGLHRDASIAYSAQFSKLAKDPDLELEPQTADAGISTGLKDPVKEQNQGYSESQNLGADATCEKEEGTARQPAQAWTEERPKSAANRLIPEGDEDILSGKYFCNGCDKIFGYWVIDEPFYLCLICYEMDLCKDCYAKRMALNEEGGPTSKLTFCGMHHDYMKAPAKDWGGIKDGTISVGPEKFEFKHWLKDVEERWKEWKDAK